MLTETEKKLIHPVKLSVKHFPVSLFTSVMGVGGLSIAYQRFAGIFSIPLVSPALLILAYVLFTSISLIYLYKLFFYRSEVMAEFNHPVKANFFAAVSISLLVLGTATFSFHRTMALVLWGAGTLLQLLIMLIITSRWITRDYELAHLNPAWFLPAAANLLVPIVGVEFVSSEVTWFFFSIGLFFWVVLFIMIFYRLTFHHRLADKFIPTLFILLAPPALGFISYVTLTGTFDAVARVLLDVALFFVLLLLFTLPYIIRVRYSVSWWAFTFPVCIATSAVALAYQTTGSIEYAWISGFLLIFSTLAVSVVSLKTLSALKQNTLFED